MAVVVGLLAPAAANATEPDPLTTGDIVGALDGAGTRVLNSAPTQVNREAAVSDSNGIEVTVPRDPSGPVQLAGEQSPGIAIGIPSGDDSTSSVVKDDVSIYRNPADNTATAVNPLEGGGAQFLVTIGDADSPTRYSYPVSVPDGADLRLTEDGGAEVVLADGTLVASIAAPWAVDAARKPVPTHFEIDGRSLIQMVDHRSEGISYPVVADPKVFACDFHTHTCVKTTKAETKAMASRLNLGLGLGASVCVILGLAGGVPGAICGVLVAIGGGLVADSISNAASKGKCIEFHFMRPSMNLTHWKTESC